MEWLVELRSNEVEESTFIFEVIWGYPNISVEAYVR